MPILLRTPLRRLSLARALGGGRLADAGRLPRYALLAALGGAAIWTPITTYLRHAPLTYESRLSLILPGAGSSATVSIDEIGSASSHAASAYASNAVSPTETYKRLIAADRILDAAAEALGLERAALGRPRVQLVDQTGLIHVALTGPAPEAARDRAEALLAAFAAEVDALRADEQAARAGGGEDAIAAHRADLAALRRRIAALEARTGLLRPAQFDAAVAANDALGERLRTAESALRDSAQAVASLEDALGLGAGLAAATLRLHADDALGGLRAEIATASAAFAEADARFGDAHPRLRSARKALDAARGAAAVRAAVLTGLPEAQAARLDLTPTGERAALLARLVRLSAEAEGARAELREMRTRHRAEAMRLAALAPDMERLEALRRDHDVAEAVFASAIGRAEAVKTDVYAAYPLVQVLENPSLPDRPSSPRRLLALAAGGAATGLMLGGLALGWLRRPLIDRVLGR